MTVRKLREGFSNSNLSYMGSKQRALSRNLLGPSRPAPARALALTCRISERIVEQPGLTPKSSATPFIELELELIQSQMAQTPFY